MSQHPTLPDPKTNPFGRPLISISDAHRQLVLSTILICAFTLVVCMNWLV